MLSDVIDYTPSQFNRKDYLELFRQGILRSLLAESSFRDKRIRRGLSATESFVFHCDFHAVSLYINSREKSVKGIAIWRLGLGK